jgi:uncharacterized protein YbjQ (UPF0145 family)
MNFCIRLQTYNSPKITFMDRNLITTATELPGYTIVSNLGVVRGITVRSRNVFMNIGASFQTLVGGNISIYSELCEKARAEAFDLLVQHADEIGADALIAIRYDANEIMAGVTEVLVYGTAVKVRKI